MPVLDARLPFAPCRAAAAVLACAAASLLAPPTASARPVMTMWRAHEAGGSVLARPLPEGALSLRSARAAQKAPSHPALDAPTQVLHTPAGEPVRVRVSPTFPPTPETRAAVQSYVDFLATRLHGSEITRLISVLAPLREVQQICGAQALGCYAPSLQIFVTPADGTPRGQVPKEYVATHEYGHHIAQNRRNTPWTAVDYGPKHWASLHRVCEKVAAKKLWPRNEGAHYGQNPGEGWAEAYAKAHYPGGRWNYDPLMRPLGGTTAAVRRDVHYPWQAPDTWVREGVLRGGSTLHTFRTPLDGHVVVRLTGPPGADLGLEVVRGLRSARSSQRPGATEAAVGYVCGATRITVRVRALRGGGRYRLVARIP